MSPAIEKQISQIGEIALSTTLDNPDEILIYAEVEDGVISANVFIRMQNNVKYKFGTSDLQDKIYDFWESWKQEPGNKEWRIMKYFINGINFDMNLIYPDQIDKNLDHMSRRQKYAESHFQELKVDYSNPR